MPSILEYSRAFSLLKRAIRFWCRVVGGWLLLDGYLLPVDKVKRFKQNVLDMQRRDQQRERARERLMRGDQEEQIDLMEALEAIEDDTSNDEDGREVEVDDQREHRMDGGGDERGVYEQAIITLATNREDDEGTREKRIGSGKDDAEGHEVVLENEHEQQNRSSEENNREQEGIEAVQQNAENDNNELAGLQENDANQDRLNAEDDNNGMAELPENGDLEPEQRERVRQVLLQREQRNLGARHQALLRFR